MPFFSFLGISADGKELTLGEIKVQLEVSEGETGLLRKKVDNLLTENLKLTKEIRGINTQLSDEKKKKPSTATSGQFFYYVTKVESFYNVNHGLSIITSKVCQITWCFQRNDILKVVHFGISIHFLS